MTQPLRTRKEIIAVYQSNINFHSARIQQIKRRKEILAVARLVTVIAGIALCYYLGPIPSRMILPAAVSILLFSFLVIRDTVQNTMRKESDRLIVINRHELDMIGQHLDGYDNGSKFSDPEHAYASDLDLFGSSSLFQWLNRCHGERSKTLLADRLRTSMNAASVKETQVAIKELSANQSYCQQLQSAAMEKPLSLQTEEKIRQCMEAAPVGYAHPLWTWFSNIYPLLPLSVVGFYIAGQISDSRFLSWLVLFYVISVLINRKAGPALEVLLDIEAEIKGVQKLIVLIESEKFQSSLLQKLQNRLRSERNSTSSKAITAFLSLLRRNDSKSNLLINMALQVFFLWDLRLIIALNDWKKENKNQFREWFTVVAEMEVLNSQASLCYNEPGWVFPLIDDRYFHFSATAIGHPLISPETRVSNDFALDGTGQIALITGSNMAGKSTFLRSLGINTVLGLNGCPVCATAMAMSEAKLITSMRVADNLAENTSTFYAELKKLKTIIDCVNNKEPVFILLDEVLRGTNSGDRHKGSQALVRQLKKSGTVAVMATHDTDLAYSESGEQSVANYHFEGRILNQELFFDYKIRNGICETLNATTLMKKIGIHFDD